MDMRAFIDNSVPTINDWQQALELVKQDGVDDLIICITNTRFNDGDSGSGYDPELHDVNFVDVNGNKVPSTDFHKKFLRMFSEWITGNHQRYDYEEPRINPDSEEWSHTVIYWLYGKCDQSLDGGWYYGFHQFSLKNLYYIGAKAQ